MIHTCGSSSWAYDDYIKMGSLRRRHPATGSQRTCRRSISRSATAIALPFTGCISTAGPVASGTVAETIAYCRKTLEIMMPGGGYCFAPTHALQDNSPTENVVAMYETAHKFGHY